MRLIADSCRDLSLLLTINTDRLLFPALTAAALVVTGGIVSLLSGV